MSIITFLAKERFSWSELVTYMLFVSLFANQHFLLAFIAWVVGFLASVVLRIASEELRQRNAGQ